MHILRNLPGIAAGILVAVLGCSLESATPQTGGPFGRPVLDDVGGFSGLPAEPSATASSGFWEGWGDGRAEMAGYRITTTRYGEQRQGELVLIYVTEPHDRRTWIKDDDVGAPHRVEVLKLNMSLKFLTGIYPYSIMTSVFAPVDRWGPIRFSPVKIAASVQEWCGSYWHELWPGQERFRSLRLSYFAGEGERVAEVRVEGNTLYEDALFIQLRELDGAFGAGSDWHGWIVPSLWQMRRAHDAIHAVPGSITRTEAERGGVPVTRFVVRYGNFTRTIDVERETPHRILGWSTSDGEQAELLQADRIAYWPRNGVGDEVYRERLGLSAEGYAPPLR